MRAEDLTQEARRVEEWLDARLGDPQESPAPRLVEAMRHSVLGGGKRLRPVLCLWVNDAGSTERNDGVMNAACSLELLHSYSLVHDDLPAMDDDDFRRGQPSCHKQFDEATAILAGDTLQTEAFAALAEIEPAELSRDLVAELARASGVHGMAAGQQLDLEGQSGPASMEMIHRLKTGALLGASIAMGARCAGIRGDRLDAIRDAGVELGIAFQIVDDVLDATADPARLGKSVGKDAAQGRLTALAMMSIDEAKAAARERLDQALAVLKDANLLDERVTSLLTLLVERDH